ncbi:hypothetical protein CAOG_06116 [Capsaspora owczarzaki ATCC 30864]|uniref:Exportin-1/Importin-beta-like domain-containing protein n=1 Tax=Capsaspora owczarzaki (strain ATCC 30864) TaxID=595528 RepID=A0A0D2X499_CAPO3|nr:hypothetical protein CAOG_06116 [Capsaspora owczarzaki ATCC 30864]KJE95689.1 hypothetical protein CAOG_006116 [Capsaspora owczarzaki ATCC 30864]|eukprot:XP_004345706.1 hypothetical protein CAOG_06116 [Capsaspora owczarzaki ATCC 30864]
MTCLNELLSRQCFPADVQHFFLALFTHACDQLTLVCETADAEGLADMDSAYLRQCTEFLRLLVIHHSARFVEMDYPIDGLLALLHRFSFALPYGTELKECLNVWAAFCDFLKVQMSNRSANGLRVNALRFQPILMEVLRLILHKTSFTTNAVELRAILEESDEADFSNTNEDEVPLWEDCLRASIELLARIADFFPNEVLEIVFPTILQCFGAFSSTQEMVVQSVEGPRLDQQSARFLEVLPLLQDLPFLLRLFGSLSELFHSHNADSERIFVERFGMAGEFLQNVLQLTAIGATLGVYTQHPVLIDIQANLFAAIRAFADWLATYNVVVIKSNDSNQLAEFEALIGNTTNVLSQCLAPNLPTMVIRNSAQLFLSLARTVRTRALLDAPFTLGLLQAPEEATAFILSLPDVMARTSFVSALVCTLLVTFQEVPEQFQMWSERYARYSSLIQEVYKPLMNAVPYLTSGGDPPLEAVTTVLDSLAMVGGIFNEFNSSVSNATRKVLLTHIEPLLPYVLQLLQACSDSPKIVAAAVQFLEQYYGCARAQVSQELVEQTVLLGGALFTCERLLPVLQSNNASEHETAERYIRILKFIVESSSRISRAALPLILSICMQNLFPALSEAPIIDVHTSFFELLEAAVVWHQGLLASTDFPVIFDMFVWSLSRPDIDLVRRNLALLENMNLKTSLYSTPAFGPLRFIVIDALLRTLTERSLSVLADEIVAAIFEMTRQHFTGFYEEFLPMFVSQCDGLTDEQQSDLVATAGREQDALSFSRNLLSFVQELNFCRRTNAAAALSQ